jgi:hypothetical protein
MDEIIQRAIARWPNVLALREHVCRRPVCGKRRRTAGAMLWGMPWTSSSARDCQVAQRAGAPRTRLPQARLREAAQNRRGHAVGNAMDE